MTPKLTILTGATVAMLLVSGCRKAEEERPVENTVVEEPSSPPAEVPPPAPAAPVVLPRSEAVEPMPKIAPEPEPTADQQVLDDADATGMTARVSRGGDDGGSTMDGNSQH